MFSDLTWDYLLDLLPEERLPLEDRLELLPE